MEKYFVIFGLSVMGFVIVSLSWLALLESEYGDNVKQHRIAGVTISFIVFFVIALYFMIKI